MRVRSECSLSNLVPQGTAVFAYAGLLSTPRPLFHSEADLQHALPGELPWVAKLAVRYPIPKASTLFSTSTCHSQSGYSHSLTSAHAKGATLSNGSASCTLELLLKLCLPFAAWVHGSLTSAHISRYGDYQFRSH
jgi:hypothetical protein